MPPTRLWWIVSRTAWAHEPQEMAPKEHTREISRAIASPRTQPSCRLRFRPLNANLIRREDCRYSLWRKSACRPLIKGQTPVKMGTPKSCAVFNHLVEDP